VGQSQVSPSALSLQIEKLPTQTDGPTQSQSTEEHSDGTSTQCVLESWAASTTQAGFWVAPVQAAQSATASHSSTGKQLPVGQFAVTTGACPAGQFGWGPSQTTVEVSHEIGATQRPARHSAVAVGKRPKLWH